MAELPQANLRVRMSSADAHYAGNLVAGATVMKLFGDVATELTIRYDDDEGLLRAYDMVEFLAPIYAGDFLQIFGKITAVGNSSRKMSFEAYKIIAAGSDTAADVLESPVLVAKATATAVVTQNKQRKKH